MVSKTKFSRLAQIETPVAPELLLPAKPISNSSIQRQQGAMISAVWITERRLDSL
jgi:hypothetical protein